MRIVKENGTVVIVTSIKAADLAEPAVVTDKKGNESYRIRRGAQNEKGGFNKFSAICNGVVDGYAAIIFVQPEDFDYEVWKEKNATAMANLVQADSIIAAAKAEEKTFISAMWDAVESGIPVHVDYDCDECECSCANPAEPAEDAE